MRSAKEGWIEGGHTRCSGVLQCNVKDLLSSVVEAGEKNMSWKHIIGPDCGASFYAAFVHVAHVCEGLAPSILFHPTTRTAEFHRVAAGTQPSLSSHAVGFVFIPREGHDPT